MHADGVLLPEIVMFIHDQIDYVPMHVAFGLALIIAEADCNGYDDDGYDFWYMYLAL